MEDALPLLAVFVIFPLILFHYITKWKTAKTLTGPDEQLLDDLYELSRRLDDRLCTIERIMNAENPDWRQSCLPSPDTEISALRERIGARGERL